MNAKHERFVAEYLKDMNGTQAAIRAGYSPRSAEVQASRLLRNAQISAAVASGHARNLAEARITATRALQEAARLAYSDIRELYTSDGKLKPIKDWPDDLAAAVGGVEFVRRNVDSADGHTDDVIKVKLWDKPKNLEMIFKHLQLFEERVRHEGEIVFRWAGK